MLVTVKGIVIRERSVGESDKYIDVLTDKIGIIEISAKGTKKLTSKNYASTALFAYSDFCLEERKGRYYINSTSPITSFYSIREDIKRLSLAVYFSDVVKFSAGSEEDCAEVQRLLLLSLHYLSQGKIDVDIIKSVFELRIMSVIGFMPNIENCCKCGSFDEINKFSVASSGICCKNCSSDEYAVQISEACLKAIKHIIFSNIERAFLFSLKGESLLQLCEICEKYLLFHLEYKFKSLDYYYSIKQKD